MKRIVPVLRAIAAVEWRELRSLNAIAANNFFLFCFLLFAMQPPSAVFLQVILGLLLFFPLSVDPLRKIPAERLELLPLDHGEMLRLRLLSVFLSPVLWLLLAITLYGGARFRGLSVKLLGLALLANVAVLVSGRLFSAIPRLYLLRDIPELPGKLGGLIQKNVREMLCVLDTYAAAILAFSGIIYRVTASEPNPDLLHGITMLALLALSTYGQRLFALDARAGFVRYRLMPLRGWEILLSKDIAFLLISGIIAAPLAPAGGIAAALAILTIGHHASVTSPVPQARWRFIAGASFTHGFLQTVTLFGAGTMAFRSTSYLQTALVLAVCGFCWLISLTYCGWVFDRRL
ncbi:MAG: hypothetical protein HY820_31605 [Acidobacteria bacterium]|nr:hypothetical protein [Acidobacteriota bacterium]